MAIKNDVIPCTLEKSAYDFAGPIMQRMFLIIVDVYSKWMDVVMMTSTTSENTINALRYLFLSNELPV